MQQLSSFDDVFAAFGGPAKFAKAIGVEPSHGQTMKTRGSIPPAYWVKTVSAASDMGIPGVTLETLAKIAESRIAS